MVLLYPNTVLSVSRPATLLVLIDGDQNGWCKQFSEEGYNVIHVPYRASSVESNVFQEIKEALDTISEGSDWGLITYGLQTGHFPDIAATLSPHARSGLKACIHLCPMLKEAQEGLIRGENKEYIPSIFHLTATQEDLFASLSLLSKPASLGYALRAAAYHPIAVYSYPKVSVVPPFPYLMKAPALVVAGEKSTTDPYVRSATGISYSRTLELLKRTLGPHYDLEKLWAKHTYYEFEERNALSTILADLWYLANRPLETMSTMVTTPYVNHVATMTGGVGFQDLARFYKYHFTSETVTPPDTELITVSRTVGADRIIDEMIFKCTHTTELDYFLPGIKPTGKPLEIALVGVVAFRGDKLTFEHIYWDQASLLVQLGLLDPSNLPVAGVEVARKVVDPFGLPSNTLMARWKESEGLPLE